MKKVVIIGAASAIASHTVKSFARDEAHLFLVDISMGRLEAVKDDILARHKTKIDLFEMNVNDFDKHQEMLDTAVESPGTCPDRNRA